MEKTTLTSEKSLLQIPLPPTPPQTPVPKPSHPQKFDLSPEEEKIPDQIDEGTMNVFGFNDDLNLDDRVII